ncbi:MAG: hypothetical protein ABL967_13375 [Bryobacteraceae bacterium]
MRFVSRLAALSALLLTSMPVFADKPKEHISFETTFQPVPGGLLLRTMPPVQAGIVHFGSTVQLDGVPVDLELIARLEYTNGSGPFSGFITLRWPNGDVLVTRYVGGAEVNPDSSSTVTGKLTVIGGEGKYLHAGGVGTVLGYRDGVFGSPVVYDVNLNVHFSSKGRDSDRGDKNRRSRDDSDGFSFKGRGKAIYLETWLTSLPSEQVLTDVGPGGRLRYGIVRLTGPATYKGSPVSVEVAAAVEYINGDGPYSGFMNFDFADGTVLCRYEGTAERDNAGNTVVRGVLEPYVGTGAYVNVRGTGRVVGTRSGAVGSPLENRIELRLR